MGLDMVPLGKPRAGFEKRYTEIFRIIQGIEKPQLSFFDKIKGKKLPTKEELLNEWFNNQIPPYETIRAPRVGRDKEADDWIKTKYEELDKKPPLDEFLKQHQGYYVIELAKELDGVPVYVSMTHDRNVFRGQFISDCVDIIGEELVSSAWNSKLADETLLYGTQLMETVDKLAMEKGLQYLKTQRNPPDFDEDSIESKLHIVYSLAKWLIFYGRNGHGYEADF